MSVPLKEPCPECGKPALESFAKGEPMTAEFADPSVSAAARCNACHALFVGADLVAILVREAERLAPTWTGTDAGDPGAKQAPEPEPVYFWTDADGDRYQIIVDLSGRGENLRLQYLPPGGPAMDETDIYPPLYEVLRLRVAQQAALKCAVERQRANAALMRDNGKLTEGLRATTEELGRYREAAAREGNRVDDLKTALDSIADALRITGDGSAHPNLKAATILQFIRDLRERADRGQGRAEALGAELADIAEAVGSSQKGPNYLCWRIKQLRKTEDLGNIARKDARVLREEVQRQTLLKVGARAEAERLRTKLAEAMAAAPVIPGSVFRAAEHARLREYLKGRGLWRPIGTDRTGGAVGCAIEAMEANRELAADLKRERSRAIGIAANFLTVEAEANRLRTIILDLETTLESFRAGYTSACRRLEEMRSERDAGEKVRAELHREIDGMRDAFTPLAEIMDDVEGGPLRTVSDVIAAAVAELRQRRKDADGGLEDDREQWRAACRVAESRLREVADQLASVQRERHGVALNLIKRLKARADALAEGNRVLGLELEAVRRAMAAGMEEGRKGAARRTAALARMRVALEALAPWMKPEERTILADPDGQDAEAWHREAVEAAKIEAERRTFRETIGAFMASAKPVLDIMAEPGSPISHREDPGTDAIFKAAADWIRQLRADLYQHQEALKRRDGLVEAVTAAIDAAAPEWARARAEMREECAKRLEALAAEVDRACLGEVMPNPYGPAAAYRYGAAEIRRLA